MIIYYNMKHIIGKFVLIILDNVSYLPMHKKSYKTGEYKRGVRASNRLQSITIWYLLP